MIDLLKLIKQNPPVSDTERGYWDRVSGIIDMNPEKLRRKVRTLWVNAGYKGKCNVKNMFRQIAAADTVVGKDHYIETVPLSHFIDQAKADHGDTIQKVTREDGTGSINYKGMTQVTSESEAIAYFQIDTNKYDIKEIIFGQSAVTMKLKDWEVRKLNKKDRVLYFQKPVTIVNNNCKVILQPRKQKPAEIYEAVLEEIRSYREEVNMRPYDGWKHPQAAVWGLSDFHYGLTGETTSVSDVCDRLLTVAHRINEAGYRENHILINGDLMEAVAIMHHSQIFELDITKTGTRGMRCVYEAFRDNLFGVVNNVTSINIVAGNHDRLSSSAKEASPFGSAAEIFYYFVKDNFPDVDVKYDYSVLSRTVDGICYILTHGDKRMSNNIQHMISEYGDEGAVYHVLITGHLHSRKGKRTVIQKAVRVEHETYISHDTSRYRHVQLPALTSPNSYAKDLGCTNGCGFAKFTRAIDCSNIDYSDIALT